VHSLRLKFLCQALRQCSQRELPTACPNIHQFNSSKPLDLVEKRTNKQTNKSINACSFTYLGVSWYGIYRGRTASEKDCALPSFHHPLQHLIHQLKKKKKKP